MVLHEDQTFGFGRNFNLRKQAICIFDFVKEIPSTLQRRAWFHSS
jgi:hypothetical protein